VTSDNNPIPTIRSIDDKLEEVFDENEARDS
jgi:hypothetical protein